MYNVGSRGLIIIMPLLIKTHTGKSQNLGDYYAPE